MLDEAVRTNRLSVIEIVGEAGIGKTTLLEHLGASAHTAGALVLSARCSEYERDVPYALLIEALDAHLAAHGPPPGLTGAQLAALGATFPALAASAGDAVERHELHRAVRALLEGLAAPRGFTLILDDLHWADPASIALVASIVRRPPARLLLAIAHRHRQADSALDPELRRAADAGRARRLTLGPLTADEASRLLARPPDDRELRRLYEESGGNPFHLMQLARTEPHAVARANDPGHGGVPEGVREAVLSETTPLGTDARALLDGAAIVGDPFEIDFAAEVAGLERAAALEALDVLVAADLVQRHRRRAPLPLPPSDRAPHRLRDGRAGPPAGRARARRRRPRARRRRPGRARPPRRAVRRARRRRRRRVARRGRGPGRRARAADGRALAVGRAHARAWSAGGRVARPAGAARWRARAASPTPAACCSTCSPRCPRTPRRGRS